MSFISILVSQWSSNEYAINISKIKSVLSSNVEESSTIFAGLFFVQLRTLHTNKDLFIWVVTWNVNTLHMIIWQSFLESSFEMQALEREIYLEIEMGKRETKIGEHENEIVRRESEILPSMSGFLMPETAITAREFERLRAANIAVMARERLGMTQQEQLRTELVQMRFCSNSNCTGLLCYISTH